MTSVIYHNGSRDDDIYTYILFLVGGELERDQKLWSEEKTLDYIEVTGTKIVA